MKMYKGRSREETKPHIYAMADGAFRNLVDVGENQSILVTYGLTISDSLSISLLAV